MQHKVLRHIITVKCHIIDQISKCMYLPDTQGAIILSLNDQIYQTIKSYLSNRTFHRRSLGGCFRKYNVDSAKYSRHLDYSA